MAWQDDFTKRAGWKDDVPSGAWDFDKQPAKYGYQNNPFWEEDATSEHVPCGYWPDPPPIITSAALPIWTPSVITLDLKKRKLYTVCVWSKTGDKYLEKIFESTIDPFAHNKVWGTLDNTDPNGDTMGPIPHTGNLSNIYRDNHVWWKRHQGDSYMACGGVSKDGLPFLFVLNGHSGIVHQLNFASWAAYGLSKNVNFVDPRTPWQSEFDVLATQVVASLNRIYVLLADNYQFDRDFIVGYVDLATYEWTLGLFKKDYWDAPLNSIEMLDPDLYATIDLRIDIDLDIVVATGWQDILNSYGWVAVYSGAGSLQRFYRYDRNLSFPYHGMGEYFVYSKGMIYSRIRYNSNQPTYKGICALNVLTGVIAIYTPDYLEADDYDFYDMELVGNKLYVTHWGYGLAELDLSDGSWRLLTGYHSYTYSIADYDFQWFNGITYDPVDNCIYCGYSQAHGTSSEIDWWRDVDDIDQLPAVPYERRMPMLVRIPLDTGLQEYDPVWETAQRGAGSMPVWSMNQQFIKDQES